MTLVGSKGIMAATEAGPSLLALAKLKASSVLNDDEAQYGAKLAADGDDSSCWNSDQVSCSRRAKARTPVIDT